MATTRERLGRPTQFHGVPLEERAFDSHGNRLPWALEWADDYPNVRHQKRQPEEKGSFGRSTRRKGSSRTTRTQTPAKKENPTIEGFEAALAFDAQSEPQAPPGNANHNAPESTNRVGPSLTKEPMQVMLYGYSIESQWAAIQFFEKVSGGMICEDYERAPPAERRRYQDGLGYLGHVHPRVLTQAERALAMQYKGGACWIKVTFDSVEAGERAVRHSPHQLLGHMVYAQPYRGQAPGTDVPITVTGLAQPQGLFGGSDRCSRSSQTLESSYLLPALPHLEKSDRAMATIPMASTATVNILEHRTRRPRESIAPSSSTATSATAISPENLLSGRKSSGENTRKALLSGNVESVVNTSTNISTTFTHFPDTLRTVLKPAGEAFLPQPSWTERLSRHLSGSGLIPGNIIGNAVPRLENGNFDWTSATLYWKVCYSLDTTFGVDLCGLKEI